jgi:hypothetical protein
MSTTDNCNRLYRWWQEQLKSHFNSLPSTMVENRQQKRIPLLHRRSSLMSFRSSNKSQSTNVKKRASFGGVEQYEQNGSAIGNGGFRYVRDSIRNKNSRTTRSTATTVTNNKGSVN